MRFTKSHCLRRRGPCKRGSTQGLEEPGVLLTPAVEVYPPVASGSHTKDTQAWWLGPYAFHFYTLLW